MIGELQSSQVIIGWVIFLIIEKIQLRALWYSGVAMGIDTHVRERAFRRNNIEMINECLLMLVNGGFCHFTCESSGNHQGGNVTICTELQEICPLKNFKNLHWFINRERFLKPGISNMGPMGAMAPVHTFPGTCQLLSESGSGQMGPLPNRASDWWSLEI